MKLTQRISQKNNASAAVQLRSLATEGAQRPSRDPRKDRFHELKSAVHHRLLETLDVSRLETLEAHVASSKVTQAVSDILDEDRRLITEVDRQRLISEVNNELLGLGPLEPLL